jgi:hypothetical protein
MQNAELGVTSDQYFEMCELTGEEPVPENIPVEFDDFSAEVQECFSIYAILQDRWEGFNGLYLGKDLAGIQDIFDLYSIDKQDRLFTLNIIRLIDGIRAKNINNRQQQKPAA